ncbi:hypothetical protein P153DRAFT_388033 [Dothidotthia symphoricarpi CBS 119687]|uniref:Uncharacterized protein n=1 Tax=Dothidotthia symphoricarpi CBS 119687 TaxID=1392245 RepID=A0A6A6A586_9PLEO|nr:uncharacterized protein P153DRAFT_388033 [Dothidotthia symphoricarpi CBS 119687]KAF2126706.1 hypothetical protein P153DRAFT_388033 [Dothidotthia symphoricarpi CBS 119687]
MRNRSGSCTTVRVLAWILCKSYTQPQAFTSTAAALGSKAGAPITNRWNRSAYHRIFEGLATPVSTRIGFPRSAIRPPLSSPSAATQRLMISSQDHPDEVAEQRWFRHSCYCRFCLIDLLERQREFTTDKAYVLREISAKKFKVYYGTWREDQDDEEKQTQISPSPLLAPTCNNTQIPVSNRPTTARRRTTSASWIR